MHLRVARLILVLRGAGRGNQRGIHGGAGFEQQAALDQQRIDCGQNLVGQLVFLQPMTKSEDGALIW